MRYLTALFILLISCYAKPISPKDASNGLTVKEQYSVEWQVTVVCPEGLYIGSSVAVSHKHVITARHVALCKDDKPAEMFALAHGNVIYPAVLDKLAGDSRVDAARLVLLMPEDEFPLWVRSVFLGKYTTEDNKGDEICTVGGDGNVDNIRKCGPVFKVEDDVEHEILISVHIVPGNSGGPAFDSYGNLVGLAVAGLWYPHKEFFAVIEPTWRWRDLLTDLPNSLQNVEK